MGLRDNAASFVKQLRNNSASSQEAETKAPTFSVSQTPNYKDYTYLNEQENYLDQFTSWTYKAIKIQADTIKFHPPKLIAHDKDGNITEIDRYSNTRTSQLLKDLYYWNPYQTYAEAREMIVYHKSLAGLAAVYMCDSETKGHKKEFYILNPLNIKVKKDPISGLPIAYEYTDGNGKPNDLAYESVIIFRNPSPKDWLKGYSPLQASRYAHNTYELASRYILNMFGNNARPDGFMVFEGVSDSEKERLEIAIKQKFEGARNAGKTGVLNKMFQWITTSTTPRELDYTKVMEIMRNEILAIHGVPPALVFSDGNLNNTIEAQRIFQRQTIKPLLFQEAEILTEQLIPKYFGNADMGSLEFQFDDPVSLDITELSGAATSLFNAGIITRNQALVMVGESELEDEEMGGEYAGANASSNAQPAEDSEDAEEPRDEVSEQLEELKSIVSSIKTKSEQESFLEAREQKRIKQEEVAVAQEVEYKRVLMNYWEMQAERVLESYNEKVPTLKNAFDTEKENAIAEKVFDGIYRMLTNDSSDIANTEIKMLADARQKLFTAKILTPEQYSEVNRIMRYSLTKVNKTTADKLRETLAKLLINADTRNFRDIKNALTMLYDNFIDGGVPTDYLRSIGAYAGRVEQKLGGSGLVSGGQDRYNRMLELLTNNKIRQAANLPALTDEQMQKGLKALKAITHNSPDSEAQTVDSLLKSIYGIDESIMQPCKPGQKGLNNECGIPQARAETVSGTETVKVRNWISREVFENNPIVSEMDWLTARDRFVRGGQPGDQFSHISADGQKVAKGQPFMVSGEPLYYPGDLKGSDGNTINCRCSVLPVID